MPRPTSETPCPIPAHQGHLHRRDSILSCIDAAGDDTTATTDIDFTSVFQASLRNTKPRRRVTGVRKNAASVDFAIHEDGEPVSGGGGGGGALAQRARKSVISQPPQRPRQKVSFANAADENEAKVQGHGHNQAQPQVRRNAAPHISKPSRSLSEAPRRPIVKVEDPLQSLPEDATTSASANITTGLTMNLTTTLKPARRGTIYIPNDDTTMPSMYMGIFSPIKDLDARFAARSGSESGPEQPDLNLDLGFEVTGIAAQMARKRAPRRRGSVFAGSPKRVITPLAVVKNVQESVAVEDQWGKGGGKENVPPGWDGKVVDEKSKARRVSVSAFQGRSRVDVEPRRLFMRPQGGTEGRVSRLCEPTASSTGRVIEKKAVQCPRARPTWNGGSRVKASQPAPVKVTSPKSSPVVTTAAPQEQLTSKKISVPSRFVVPHVKPARAVEVYPVLTEDLASPSMYEDNWLSHQEIAITQLVNNLFGASTPATSTVEDGMLRIRLLDKYSGAGNHMLYKRLQGALLYGSLSVPTDILKGAARLNTDVGKRKAFIDLWLETYNPSCLRAGLEVVVGRECRGGAPARSPSTRQSTDSGASAGRRSIQRFIETFLIRNEDGTPDPASTDRASWSYQCTLLRSLMLVKILDATKTDPASLVSSCLFQPSSLYKSSVSVVKGLFQLLNPSAGDPIRALSHIGYTVTHSQYPLEEYAYKIENLAVDLRDGVRLTRLVELLLYPSASQSLEHAHDADSTTTVFLPTGEQLLLTEAERGWPLSQHLKFPCLGRATKLYNVQIALSALQGVKGMTALVQDVKAEDIVDGFREKSVKLLWGLTSKWGLGGLVDWDDVEREIKQLCRWRADPDDDFFDALEDKESPARYKALLKSWAQAVASKRGIVVKNLTTSFADGRVFEAIVDEYEGRINCDTDSSQKSRGLSERLRDLGCSEQFAGLFSTSEGSPNRTHIFDRDFVLAALAFLCSRLLGPSKGVRAAVTIQKAWRAYWGRVLEGRKKWVKTVAERCAAAVRVKEQALETKPANVQAEGCGVPIQASRHEAEVECEDSAQHVSPPAVEEEEDIWLNL